MVMTYNIRSLDPSSYNGPTRADKTSNLAGQHKEFFLEIKFCKTKSKIPYNFFVLFLAELLNHHNYVLPSLMAADTKGGLIGLISQLCRLISFKIKCEIMNPTS